MDRNAERAYKRTCFQGRGSVARWLDRGFFSGLGGVCLYILTRNMALSGLLCMGLFALLTLWDGRRWSRFKRKVWQDALGQLKREEWLQQEAELIRKTGGVLLFPTPGEDDFMGLCLRHGPGTIFHFFGDARKELTAQALALGCTASFHPWGEGKEPSREQVMDRLRRDAPVYRRKLWRSLLQLPGNRYLLTGFVLLVLSLFLRRALYWRLLGSVCLLFGTFRRSLRVASGP